MNAPLPALQGVVHGMSNADYHGNPALSKGKLADFMVCPANYYGLYEDPDRSTPEQTAGQRAGTLLHTLVLEPDTFADRYAVGPNVNRNTNAWKAFEASLRPGVEPIKPDEYQAGLRQAKSLRAHKEVADVLAHGFAETSIFWTDPDTGLACRCRPDWMHELPQGWIVLDLKTGPAEPRTFGLQCARMTYDVQDAFYSDGIEVATGKPVLAFLFGVIETTEPMLASCCALDDDARESGRIKVRRAMRRFAECKAKNEWPGYEGVQTISLPRYALAE